MRPLAVRCLAAFLALASVEAWAGNFKVLVLIGDARQQESPILTKFNSVGGHTFTFEEVKIEGGTFDGNFRGAQIVWFPWNGPGHDGGYFMGGTEAAFKDWVKKGGAVWIAAFDDNYRDPAGKQVGGWMPIDEHPVVVQNTGDSDVQVTPEGDKSGLLAKPNKVDLNTLTLDDNFANLDKSWVVLATRKDNGQPAAAYLKYGRGIYVEVCYDTRDAARAAAASSLLENGLSFLAAQIGGGLAVAPNAKAATTWAAMKTR
jgi:hypothetical protein